MITAQVQQQSVSAVNAYFDQTKQRIFAAVREGVAEGTEQLSWTIADKLQGNPIVSRSGELLGAVLNGVRLRETANAIQGSVFPDTGRKNLAQWLEEGTSIPGVQGKLMAFFSAAMSGLKVIRSHQAFKVAPHPFMNTSLAESEGPIFDLILQKVTEVAPY